MESPIISCAVFNKDMKRKNVISKNKEERALNMMAVRWNIDVTLDECEKYVESRRVVDLYW